MDTLTTEQRRRSSRLQVEIPLTIASLDRRHPFSAACVALVVSGNGCAIRAAQALPLETPVLLGALPGGASAAGRVASCRPVGTGGNEFVIGVSLYNHGNVWGVANPPTDWNCEQESFAVAASNSAQSAQAGNKHP